MLPVKFLSVMESDIGQWRYVSASVFGQLVYLNIYLMIGAMYSKSRAREVKTYLPNLAVFPLASYHLHAPRLPSTSAPLSPSARMRFALAALAALPVSFGVFLRCSCSSFAVSC